MRILMALIILLFCGLSAATPQRFDYLTVELLSAQRQIAPGDTLRMAFKMQHDPHWHTYWKYPGDSGLPTKASWRVNGVASGAPQLRWPVPKPLVVGGIHNIGYEGELWLLVDYPVPRSAPMGTALELSADLSWLVCKEECIPGQGQFALRMPIASSTEANTDLQADFDRAVAALPEAMPEAWRNAYFEQAQQIQFAWQADHKILQRAKNIQLFLGAESFAAVAASPVLVQDKDTGRAYAYTERPQHESYVGAPASVEALWVVDLDNGAQIAYQGVMRAAQSALAPTAASRPANETTSPQVANMGLAVALLSAFFGGLLLNLMPCVLPVLSLKVMSLLDLTPSTVRAHALAYSAGVIVSFLSLAAVLLLLRAGGQALGWGFQLQSPMLVALLCMVMFALALSMSGVVHFGTSLAQLEQYNDAQPSLFQAFFSGVLAAVVASPCTAPLMAGALGYALLQPAAVAVWIMGSLGVGLAAPMLLLAWRPAWAQHLPKPGKWMQSLKEWLAIPLYLAAIWLLWVFGQQRDMDAVALLLIALLMLAVALMWLERLRYLDRGYWRALAGSLALAALVLGSLSAKAPMPDQQVVNWQRYSAEDLAQLRSQNRAVLVQMTAAWCVTCKVNERVAMSGPAFAEALKRYEVLTMKGDWTHQDAKITEFLRQYGAAGVPLVVVYSKNGSAEILPQLLSPDVVEQALKRAAGT